MGRIRPVSGYMRFTPSFLDEIKARLPVSEVVRRRVKLRRPGASGRGCRRSMRKRRRPSSSMTRRWPGSTSRPASNGNVFDFVMETEGLSFPEAVERLAGRSRAVAAHRRRRRSSERERERASLHDVLEHGGAVLRGAAAGAATAPGRAAISPTAGSAPRSRQQFRLGYSPQRTIRAARPSRRQGRHAATR